ncbi:hypothetical protein PG993_014144 [Apiospora rasikravindrae]|uniref:Multicopper oxidase n=1 Tax=Apiospora rasikravindrae TaxID=990691 RepID=A0ABR1RS84_9PEZI
MPIDGVLRKYDWTLSRGYLSPDGYNKSGIFVNGQFPGPTIEANWGDWIEVTVHNNIIGDDAEGTAIHWHGLTQRNTQEFDGVPSITQCPIAPGATFTYRFQADLYGTTFWHSHYSAQWTAGVHGAFIIHGPKHVPYDEDLGPILVGDYYHKDYFTVLEAAASDSPDFDVYVPSSDNSLINGKANYNCSMASDNATCHSNAGLAKFRFRQGKSHRLRLINGGAAALVHFSIDNHRLQVIAHDMTPLVPYEVDYVTLGAGQRTDVVVQAVGASDSAYWMRSTISMNCSAARTQQGMGIVLYDSAPEEALPQSERSPAATAADEKSFLCQNVRYKTPSPDPLRLTTPLISTPPASIPSTTITVNVTLATNDTGHHVWLLNNVTQWANYNRPLLGLASAENYTGLLDPVWNVYDLGSNKTIRIVMNTDYQSAHPMHLHGHQFAVLSEGLGPFNGSIDPAMLANPPRRDVHMMPRYGHLVIQFEADNPGAWSYHCHIAWHSAMGYTVNILERPDEIRGGRIADALKHTCSAWDAYTQQHVVDQIDSGI